MVIKDIEDKYILVVDRERRLVCDAKKGAWKKEDFDRYYRDFQEKVIPYLGTESWAKLDDYENYIPSIHVNPDLINTFIRLVNENGLKKVALTIASATMKIQIKRAVESTGLELTYFSSVQEGDAWLKTQGF